MKILFLTYVIFKQLQDGSPLSCMFVLKKQHDTIALSSLQVKDRCTLT